MPAQVSVTSSLTRARAPRVDDDRLFPLICACTREQFVSCISDDLVTDANCNVPVLHTFITRQGTPLRAASPCFGKHGISAFPMLATSIHHPNLPCRSLSYAGGLRGPTDVRRTATSMASPTLFRASVFTKIRTGHTFPPSLALSARPWQDRRRGPVPAFATRHALPAQPQTILYRPTHFFLPLHGSAYTLPTCPSRLVPEPAPSLQICTVHHPDHTCRIGAAQPP